MARENNARSQGGSNHRKGKSIRSSRTCKHAPPLQKKEVRRGAVFKTLVSPKKQNLQRDTKFRTRVQNEGLKNEGPKRGSNEGPKRGSQKRGSKTRVQNEVQEQKTRVKRGSTEKRPSFLRLISGRDLVGTLIENCTFGNQKKKTKVTLV